MYSFLFNIQILQDNAATDLRWGGKFCFVFFYSSPVTVIVHELLKSVRACQSERKNKSGTFFVHPLCIHNFVTNL